MSNLVLLIMGIGLGILFIGLLLTSTPIFFIGFGITILGSITAILVDSNIDYND